MSMYSTIPPFAALSSAASAELSASRSRVAATDWVESGRWQVPTEEPFAELLMSFAPRHHEKAKASQASKPPWTASLRLYMVAISSWSLLSAFCAITLTTIGNSSAVAATFWLSPHAGPFAFVPQAMWLQEPVWSIALCLCLIGLIGARLASRQWWSSVLSVLGISLWFIIGLAVTYVGV